jgi:hypothetical protein
MRAKRGARQQQHGCAAAQSPDTWHHLEIAVDPDGMPTMPSRTLTHAADCPLSPQASGRVHRAASMSGMAPS